MAKGQPQEPSIGSCDIYVVKLRNINSQAVSDAIRTIHSLNAPRAGASPALPDQSGRRSRVAHAAPPPAEDVDDAPLFVDVLADVDEEQSGQQPSVAPQPAATSTTKRETRLPKGAQIDFNSETPTLRDFALTRKPQSQLDWYLLVASWMKTAKSNEEIGLPHIVTAKQYIGADWPKLSEDAGKPFRDGCRPTSGVFTKEKRAHFKITSVGEDRVARMSRSE